MGGLLVSMDPAAHDGLSGTPYYMATSFFLYGLSQLALTLVAFRRK
jgi:hypothetical protein